MKSIIQLNLGKLIIFELIERLLPKIFMFVPLHIYVFHGTDSFDSTHSIRLIELFGVMISYSLFTIQIIKPFTKWH